MATNQSKTNAIINYLRSSDREQEYDRRNTAIAVSAQPVILTVFMLIGDSFHAAIGHLGLVDGLFLVTFATPVVVMNPRHRSATGLAAATATGIGSIETTVGLVQAAFPCDTRRFDREHVVFLACRTPRSNLSYGEWIVASIEPTSAERTRNLLCFLGTRLQP